MFRFAFWDDFSGCHAKNGLRGSKAEDIEATWKLFGTRMAIIWLEKWRLSGYLEVECIDVGDQLAVLEGWPWCFSVGQLHGVGVSSLQPAGQIRCVLFLKMQFYGNPALTVLLHIICGCFCHTLTDRSNLAKTTWSSKHKIFTIWPFKRMFAKGDKWSLLSFIEELALTRQGSK